MSELYTVEIVETLSKCFDVIADSKEEAYRIIKQKYKDEEIILTADDFEESNIDVLYGRPIDIDKYLEYFADSDNSFMILQLKSEADRHLSNSDYEYIIENGYEITQDNYNVIYAAELNGMKLEDIFTRFNIHHPDDYCGHSLSVSDVIMIKQDEEYKAFYVDDIGFKELPEFMEMFVNKSFIPFDEKSFQKWLKSNGFPKFTPLEIDTLLGYMKDHDYILGKHIDGNIARMDMASGCELVEAYSIKDAIEFVCEMNAELIQVEESEQKLIRLQADGKVLDDIYDKIYAIAQCKKVITTIKN